MEATYETECWAQTYRVRANWADGASPVMCQYEDEDWQQDHAGRQVADFQHSPLKAMRAWLLAGENADTDAVGAADDACWSMRVVEEA